MDTLRGLSDVANELCFASSEERTALAVNVLSQKFNATGPVDGAAERYSFTDIIMLIDCEVLERLHDISLT